MITAAQLKDLQDKVAKLVDDKGDADGKTAASNSADAAAVKATADAAQAKLEEANADAVVTADVADLTSFIDGLAAAPVPAPAPQA